MFEDASYHRGSGSSYLGLRTLEETFTLKDGFVLPRRHLTCSDGTDSVKLSIINWNGDEADVTIKILLRP